MSKPITRYSKALNLSDSLTDDKNTDDLLPYSFNQWLGRHIGVSPSREFAQYNTYLKDWYSTRQTKFTNKEVIKQQYKNLIRELAVVFRDDIEQNIWLTRVNFDDDWDLETIIPFYARKLKEIAVYLAGRREIIKQAKLKYNLVGSVQALEKLFHNYLLRAFTKQDSTLGVADLSAWSQFSELSAIREGFSLSIEELYDDQEYFDKDPSVDVSEYFDTTNPAITSYYSSLNFPTSALSWLYQTGFASTSANNPATWTLSGELSDAGVTSLTEMPISAFELEDNRTLNTLNYFDLSNNYLGEPQWIALGGYHVSKILTYPFNFVQGNNWFYWPSGEYYNEADVNLTLNPIELSATNFALFGTAGSDYTDSDVIFVREGEETTGAWLAQIDYTTETDQMSALIEPNTKTTFKFPWPGVGLSGEDISWTGKSLSNLDKTFDYLSDDFKRAIIDAYWEDVDNLTKITPLLLNYSDLAESGATASTSYFNADKITVRPRSSIDSVHDDKPDGIYTSAQQYAWLYKFTSTQIPVTTGINQMLWPISRLSTTTSASSAYLPTECIDVPLSSFDVTQVFSGSTAGSSFGLGDTIIKLSAFGSNVVEMAWLSGCLTSVFNSDTPGISAGSLYNGTVQAGLNAKILAGNYTTFLWAGPDLTDVNSIIHHHEHTKDCPYFVLQQTLPPLSTDVANLNVDIGAQRWDFCTCKAFYHSPVGHSGAITSFYGVHDFILEDFGYPFPFDIEGWRDSSNNKYNNSQYFAWYKTVANDISYDDGAFVNTATGGQFLLRRGHIYRYYRSNLKRDASNFSVPYLVLGGSLFNHRHPTVNASLSTVPMWIKAQLQEDGNWQSTDKRTDMVLRLGDVITYNHYNAEQAVDFYTYRDSGINYLLTAPLSGWNYATHTLDLVSAGARPYWAYADDQLTETQFKGTPVFGGRIQVVDEYTQTNLPSASEIFLSNDLFFEYERVGTSMIWYQNVDISTFVNIQQWNQLLFDTEVSSLSDIADPNATELSLSATQDPADITLSVVANLQPVLINYYARAPMTLTQDLSDSTLGIPPTGGTWIEPVSSVYIDPLIPHGNLANRHYPTVATAQNMGLFYNSSDTGGYLVPKYLGASVYLGRNFTTTWANTSGTAD